MTLSPQERRILAGIEDDLRSDPDLATRFARSALPSTPRLLAPGWFPLATAHVMVLVLLLVVLVVAHPIALWAGPAGLGLLTAMLTVPWLVRVARAGTSRSPREAESAAEPE